MSIVLIFYNVYIILKNSFFAFLITFAGFVLNFFTQRSLFSLMSKEKNKVSDLEKRLKENGDLLKQGFW